MRIGLIVVAAILLVANLVLIAANLNQRQQMAPVLDQMYQEGLDAGLQLRPPPR